MGNHDLIILGGGPAGYSAAIRAAQLGASVLLVEKGEPGGTCLNRGCIPTKFLWETLHVEKKIRRAADWGLSAELKELSFAQVQQKKTRTVDLLVKSLRRLIESYSITLLKGEGKFSGPGEIEATLTDGSTRKISAKKVIIAAGSRPKSIPGITIDHSKFIDSTDALSLSEAPKTLLVIGGGAVGVEMATVFRAMGGEVKLLEKEPQLLPGEDAELAQEVRKALERSGVSVSTGEGYSPDMAGAFEKVLVVTGRASNADLLGLDRAGIAFTRRGVTVDEYLETSRPGVYAAGDVAGNWYLAYTAQAEGVIAAENAMGAKERPDYSVIPRVVFSLPAAASVGAAGQSLPAESTVTGKFPFSANSRSSLEGERMGWAKVTADKKTGVLLSGQVIGPSAEELIALLSLAIRHQLTLHDLRRELFFHPSLSEALHHACEDALNKCVEILKKQ